MATLFALVHAPVLGPASWRPVEAELSDAGHRVVVPSLTGFSADGPPYARKLVRLCADQVRMAAQVGGARGTRPPAADGTAEFAAERTAEFAAERTTNHVVLVVHSGAGPLAGQIAAAVQADGANSDRASDVRVSIVFADAGLPRESGATPVVDAGFLPYLREIAKDGVVPPWQQWWPGADPSELFPSEAARDAALADTRPLPLAFFEESLPPLPCLRGAHAAGYLLFSGSYRPEADEARRRGWPVTELAGSHVHPLVNPAEVASAIIGLTERL